MRTEQGFFESTSMKKTSDGLRVRIRLISAGQGSSGNYTESMLEQRGPQAFPAGTKLFYNHPSVNERETHRDVRLIFGKTLTDAEYVAEEKALYADAHVFEKDAEFIQQIMSDVDLSIEAAGDYDENDDVVLEYSPTNAVALVPTGGRDGKITALIESHITANVNTFTECGTMENVKTPHIEENKMTKEEMQELLKEALAEFKAEILESLKPEDQHEEAADVKTLVKALGDADLPDEAVDAVLESATPLEAIETFKAVKMAVLESAKAPAAPEKRREVTNYNFNEAQSGAEARKNVGAWS